MKQLSPLRGEMGILIIFSLLSVNLIARIYKWETTEPPLSSKELTSLQEKFVQFPHKPWLLSDGQFFAVFFDDCCVMFSRQVSVGPFYHSIVNNDFLAFWVVFQDYLETVGRTGKTCLKRYLKRFLF